MLTCDRPLLSPLFDRPSYLQRARKLLSLSSTVIRRYSALGDKDKLPMAAQLGPLLDSFGNSTTVILPNKGNARDQTINIIIAVGVIVLVSAIAAAAAIVIRKKHQDKKLRQQKASIVTGTYRSRESV